VRLLREALERLEQDAPGEGTLRARYEIDLGFALLDLGQTTEAADFLARADRVLHAESDPAQSIRSLWSRARADAEAQNHQVALRTLRKAAILLEAGEELKELGESRLRLAQALAPRGKSES
jgi:tetratricopeptide (TPR) repeat protein